MGTELGNLMVKRVQLALAATLVIGSALGWASSCRRAVPVCEPCALTCPISQEGANLPSGTTQTVLPAQASPSVEIALPASPTAI